MPSKEVYEQFLKEGIRVDNDPYCRYDSLATKEDLEILFEALQSVKDKNGKPAVLTADAFSTLGKREWMPGYFIRNFTEGNI